MSDSLIIEKFAELKIIQDSTFNTLHNIEKVVTGLQSEGIFIKLLPLIGVVIGGLITWFIQKGLKEKEITLTVKKDLRETLTRILSSLTSLQFHLKELAYLEVDSKYQYYIYCSSTSTEEEKKRALDEHYADYKYISDVKNKISACVADTNSSFITYYKLTNSNIPDESSNKLLDFTNHILSLQREKEFCEAEINTKILEQKISSLTEEYTKHIVLILNLAREL